MDRLKLIEKIKKFPDTPGVYFMRDSKRKILYIGKATSLHHRVISYFQRPQEDRIEKMLSQVATIETQKTDSAIEALLYENDLIKKHQPKYNVRLKDDKTYLGIYITHEDWPRVMPARKTEKLPKGEFYGPFPSSYQVKEALQVIRKIFPFRYACEPMSGKACFEYHMGLCPGVCAGKISQEDYGKTIKQIKLFLHGKKKQVIKNIEKEMKISAKNLEFEKAAKLRDRVFALRHIQDTALVLEEEPQEIEVPKRIEAYDISNISGAFAVGSMIVFTEGLVDKNQYRKFRIKNEELRIKNRGMNDVGAIKEILNRRLNHKEWQYPDLILVDGGKPQAYAAKEVIAEHKLNIPIVGIAKGPARDRNDIITDKNINIDKKLLIKIRDEAHRFAITYYRLRHRKSLR
jgi:excinuclease ABC subunit C